MVAQRLLSSSKACKLRPKLRILSNDIVHHRLVFVGKQEAQIFTYGLEAERVDCANLGLALVRRRCEARSDVVRELLGDYTVECDDKYAGTRHLSTSRMNEPLNAPDQTKGFSRSRPGLHTDYPSFARNQRQDLTPLDTI